MMLLTIPWLRKASKQATTSHSLNCGSLEEFLSSAGEVNPDLLCKEIDVVFGLVFPCALVICNKRTPAKYKNHNSECITS